MTSKISIEDQMTVLQLKRFLSDFGHLSCGKTIGGWDFACLKSTTGIEFRTKGPTNKQALIVLVGELRKKIWEQCQTKL